MTKAVSLSELVQLKPMTRRGGTTVDGGHAPGKPLSLVVACTRDTSWLVAIWGGETGLLVDSDFLDGASLLLA